MARIAGIQLPKDKRIEVALTYIYGIGDVKSKRILAQAGISPDVRVKDIPEGDVNRLREIVEKQNKVEGELRREILLNVKRLKEIGSYRGSRHAKNLPARGQRTKTNSRTRRGNKRMTAGSGRKLTGQKT